MIEIFKVTYPDVRRGPKGVSSALFRNPKSARAFASRLKGSVTPVVVSEEELERLVRNRLVDVGTPVGDWLSPWK